MKFSIKSIEENDTNKLYLGNLLIGTYGKWMASGDFKRNRRISINGEPYVYQSEFTFTKIPISFFDHFRDYGMFASIANSKCNTFIYSLIKDGGTLSSIKKVGTDGFLMMPLIASPQFNNKRIGFGETTRKFGWGIVEKDIIMMDKYDNKNEAEIDENFMNDSEEFKQLLMYTFLLKEDLYVKTSFIKLLCKALVITAFIISFLEFIGNPRSLYTIGALLISTSLMLYLFRAYFIIYKNIFK